MITSPHTTLFLHPHWRRELPTLKQGSKQPVSRKDISDLSKLIRDHDERERSTDTAARLEAVEGHYEVLNREMGEVVGALKGINDRLGLIQWLVGGTTLAAAAAALKLLFGL